MAVCFLEKMFEFQSADGGVMVMLTWGLWCSLVWWVKIFCILKSFEWVEGGVIGAVRAFLEGKVRMC
jgi:hypothetical protein